MSLTTPSTRRAKTSRTDRPPSATPWPRLWASCTKRSLTSSRRRGGSAIPCASSAASSRKLAPGCASSERAF
ncbi:unnamed protein product [Cladocopium goreaui]|uniref:Uncharacterized protein n=1 Tax=Cladocopium goreaui TaxID=2562237 RepID=A0A9P1CM19_9DINO|nr:unnamed protein product [Cladocopium goreaui]